MVDLRLESTDGEYLVLESPDGTTFRLLIDETVRKAVRRESVSAADSNRISPRDIQLEVRSGVTIEELSRKTGASLDYIEKFAAPVIDELAHVVSSALSVRITMAGDRYNETTQVEFGEVVATRLANAGVVQYSWSARKSDNHGWQLHCKFEDKQATWAFDPRKLVLTPENEAAIALSAQQSLTDGPIPRLRPVDVPVSAAPAFEPTFADPLPPITQSLTVVVDVPSADVDAPSASQPEAIAPVTTLPVAPQNTVEPVAAAVTEEAASITRDLGDTAEFEGVIPFGRQISSTPAFGHPSSSAISDVIDDGTDLANTADLLDALRKRRIERERDVLTAATGSITIIPEPAEIVSDATAFKAEASQPEPDFETESAYPEEVDLVSHQEFDGVDEPADTRPIDLVESDVAAAEAEKPKKTGRSSMPSWDEIVFNTRHDED